MKEKKSCSVTDCQTPSRKLGFCEKHYRRYKTHGDPLFSKYRTGSLEERLKGDIDTSGGDDACHPWGGDCSKAGYGVIKFEGKGYYVTRAVMTVELGRELASEEWVLHTCDNPPCSNRKHLYIGDPKQNALDRKERGRHWSDRLPPKTHCKRGHEFTPENTYMTKTGRSCLTCRRATARAHYERNKGGGLSSAR